MSRSNTVADQELTDQEILAHSRALGDPTRHAVFVYLRDAPAPVGVAELTEHFGLNHNAIRQHLARLTDAGLVVGELAPPSGPGRPARRYRAAPGVAERWGGESPFEALSMMLLELLRGGRSPREVGRAAGRRLALEAGADRGSVELLDLVARRLGFEPDVEPSATGADVVLGRCPFVQPASIAPEVVCDLHLGIAEGIADQADDDARIDELVLRPPERAGCRIQVVAASA